MKINVPSTICLGLIVCSAYIYIYIKNTEKYDMVLDFCSFYHLEKPAICLSPSPHGGGGDMWVVCREGFVFLPCNN